MSHPEERVIPIPDVLRQKLRKQIMVMFFYVILAWENGRAKNNVKTIPKSETVGCFQVLFLKNLFLFLLNTY